MFMLEQQFTAINQQCKEIIFDNCRNIAGNCCSQNKLFSVVNVAVNKSKTSCHQVIISFWHCKGTTFPRGIVRFSPFQSSKTQVSAMVNAGICDGQRRYLRRPMKVSAMRDEDYKRDSVTVYYIWFSRKRKLTSYIVSEFHVIGIFYI